MRLATLFTGGKDSVYATYLAQQAGHQISCLLSIESKNLHSYMFHTPNISLTSLQAEAMGIPIIIKKTLGEKEVELKDLKVLIQEAVKKYKIDGIITGAVGSVYQASRIQKICSELGLWCFNPLWLKDQVELLNELEQLGFESIIGGVFAYPLDETFLGKPLNKKMIVKLIELNKKYQINPAGEGGEIETFVINCPLFKKKIIIKDFEIKYKDHTGFFVIKEAKLE